MVGGGFTKISSQNFNLGSLQCLVHHLIKISYSKRIILNEVKCQLLLLRTPVDVSFNRSRIEGKEPLTFSRHNGNYSVDHALRAFFFNHSIF